MLNTHAHSLLWKHVRKPYPYVHIQKTVMAYLEIDEVIVEVECLKEVHNKSQGFGIMTFKEKMLGSL